MITKDQDGTSYHLSMVFLYLMDFTDIPGGMGPYSLSFRHEILFGDPSFGTEWNTVLTVMLEYIQTLPPNDNSIGVEEMSWCQKELAYDRKHGSVLKSLHPSVKSRSSPHQRSGRNVRRQKRFLSFRSRTTVRAFTKAVREGVLHDLFIFLTLRFLSLRSRTAVRTFTKAVR